VVVVAEYIGHSMLSSESRDNENRSNGYHGYHRIEGQGDIATTMAPTLATMATTNAAAASLDSKWTPRRHFHTAWSRTREWVTV
jgi:hypothetical protein